MLSCGGQVWPIKRGRAVPPELGALHCPFPGVETSGYLLTHRSGTMTKHKAATPSRPSTAHFLATGLATGFAAGLAAALEIGFSTGLSPFFHVRRGAFVTRPFLSAVVATRM